MSNLTLKIWFAIWAAIIAAVYFTTERNQIDSQKKKPCKKKLVDEESEIKVMRPGNKRVVDDDYKLLLTEIKLAEDCMSADDHEKAVRHFANAIVMSSDPLMFVNSLSQTLPTATFRKLINVLNDTYGEVNRQHWKIKNEKLTLL